MLFIDTVVVSVFVIVRSVSVFVCVCVWYFPLVAELVGCACVDVVGRVCVCGNCGLFCFLFRGSCRCVSVCVLFVFVLFVPVPPSLLSLV